MPTLSLNVNGKLCLTLRGMDENPILATIRRWPYWQQVVLEPDPVDPTSYCAVTLVTDPIYETLVRDILQRGFAITFPSLDGAAIDRPMSPLPPRQRRH